MRAERVVAEDLQAFERVADSFARSLRPGDAIALSGDLGAGKTTFVAAVTRALGSMAEVSSPTFIFRNRYDGPIAIEHLDLYRIEDPAEAVELGLHDAFSSETITFVEWPSRLPDLLPARAIAVRIVGSGDEPRTVVIERPG
jgi:tRNA threonylcarbamoyladenosine biosynthesis protein TsaE